jgi:hypothetical protein
MGNFRRNGNRQNRIRRNGKTPMNRPSCKSGIELAKIKICESKGVLPTIMTAIGNHALRCQLKTTSCHYELNGTNYSLFRILVHNYVLTHSSLNINGEGLNELHEIYRVKRKQASEQYRLVKHSHNINITGQDVQAITGMHGATAMQFHIHVCIASCHSHAFQLHGYLYALCF